MQQPTPKIVAAVGTIAVARDSSRAQQLEAAMAAAVLKALADGVAIDDADEMRARMAAARAAVPKDE